MVFCLCGLPALAQQKLTLEDYEKEEYFIPMRDGVELFTAVYSPKDKSKKYPILMNRTPYSVRPYGEDSLRNRFGPSEYLMEDGYIFVYQDVRGRYMSEGLYDNMRPQINFENKKKQKEIDESTDTYDTIDWLLKNLDNDNGKVGQWGISYPGFYTAAGLISNHPALKASSPQAPIADFYFDDFHHRGAYTLSYFLATPVFGYQKDSLVKEPWYPMVDPGTPDGYQFYMDLGPLKNASKYYGEDNFFWQQLSEHPNYDEFWQKRNILPHLRNIDHAVMTVGGWFDAEDLYGPLSIYKTIEKHNPDATNMLVMGPWSHGDWARDRVAQTVGFVHFGDSISDFYQKNIEYPFFSHQLKGMPDPGLPEAYVFDTGLKKWRQFTAWPPAGVEATKWFLHDNEQLELENPDDSDIPYSEFISDPNKPVPYTDQTKIVFTPRAYMAGDERHAARRPDVLVFETEVLEEDVTLAGEILAHLMVSTSQTDADWVVKLIDVYPPDAPDYEGNPENIRMGNYHQLVRSEIMRGRFRNSFEEPEPFTPDEVTKVEFPLQDVLHTFKKGHKIQVQVQSTWFPLFDRNPQKYVENIFEADEDDFVKALHRVYHNPEYPSYLEVDLLKR
nr:CocE/NonD family hydrolase [Nafulsella turpanensis]